MDTFNDYDFRTAEERGRWENIRQRGYSNGLPSHLRQKARNAFGQLFVTTAARGGDLPLCVGDVLRAKRALSN